MLIIAAKRTTIVVALLKGCGCKCWLTRILNDEYYGRNV